MEFNGDIATVVIGPQQFFEFHLELLESIFIGPEPQKDAEVAGGYAREQTEEEKQKALEALAAHVKDQDLVITTAQIPGRKAPRDRRPIDAQRASALDQSRLNDPASFEGATSWRPIGPSNGCRSGGASGLKPGP